MSGEGVILEARGLTRRYPAGRQAKTGGSVRAVEGVSLRIRERETVALVGESGCGKSTTARLLLGLEPPSAGEVRYRGRDLEALSAAELRDFRRSVQLVFQDPFGSLNPRLTVGSMLTEVLAVHELVPRAKWPERIGELLTLVGLDADVASRYPHEVSGGQRQRIGVARALAVEPELIVADEPVSALDVSIQAQVLNLLADLQARLGLSYLFIAHDLAVVRQVADRVAVMYGGRIVELARADELFARPLHPYTKALLAAVPSPRPPEAGRRNADAPLPEGEVVDAPSFGCPFYPRCPSPAKDGECVAALPALEERRAGRRVRCVKA